MTTILFSYSQSTYMKIFPMMQCIFSSKENSPNKSIKNEVNKKIKKTKNIKNEITVYLYERKAAIFQFQLTGKSFLIFKKTQMKQENILNKCQMCMIIFNLFQSRYFSVFLPGFYKVFEIVTLNLLRTLWHCQECPIKMVLILSFIEVILKMVFYLCRVYFEVEVSLFCDVALKLIFRNKEKK